MRSRWSTWSRGVAIASAFALVAGVGMFGSSWQSSAFADDAATTPTFTSAAFATAIVGNAFSFTVTTSGTPAPTLSLSDSLPPTFTFTDNGDGTATIAGNPPADADVGQYAPVTLTATNDAGTATQSLTLTVAPPLAIHGPGAWAVADGERIDLQWFTGGFLPFPTMNESGALPDGLSFVDSGQGSADLAGTTTEEGVYSFTITADNGIEPDATETVNLTVEPASPIAFSSAPSVTVVAGTSFTFLVTSTGVPTVSSYDAENPDHNFRDPAFPAGVSFGNNFDGTATISGTAQTRGTSEALITASDFSGSDRVTQTFTLNVIEAAPGCVATDCNSGVSTDPNGSIEVVSGGAAGVSATANGVGALTVGQYAGDPVSAPAIGATGAYFDVAVSGDNAFTSLALNDCDLMGGNAVEWWNPNANAGAGAWQPVSPQTFVAGSPDCVDAEIDLNSTPSLADLTGSIFAIVNATPTRPTVTSAATATATIGQPATFTVTTTGFPTATLTRSGTLPTGMTFVDNGNGTATLSGTPTGTAKSYALKITAKNTAGSITQNFSLVVNQTPAITSATTATFTTSKAGTFKVTTTGSLPALTLAGTLPNGVTFLDNGNGTAKLAGTPGAGTAGTYPVTISASNAAGTVAQSFSLVVTQAPAVTSATSTTATIGQPAGFTVTATGLPTPTLTLSGTLPTGITFVDNGNGTATLSGTATGTAKTYALKITAKNTAGSITQNFSLVVNQTPAITSATTATFTTSKAGTFKVTTTGSAPVLTLAGSLPNGVTFLDNGNGTAKLAGTPGAGTAGTYPVTITATNTAGAVTQDFTLVVTQIPVITSATTTTATIGHAATFTVTTTGFPTAALTHSGTLPTGMTFVDNGNGTATLSGTPTGTAKTYALKFIAKNTAGSITQNFSLVLNR